MEHSSREEILAQTLMEMQSAEPEGFENSGLNSCNLSDSNAEHTIGMWQIWTTAQE
jgi:hypothetical protein